MSNTANKRRARPRVPPVNAPWLKQRLDALGLTQRWTAEQLGMDYPAFTRTMNGHRAWTIQDAVTFASVVNVPLTELLPQIGVELRAADTSAATEYAPVVWQVVSDGDVRPASNAGKAPLVAPRAGAALRLQNSAGLDTATMFLDAEKPAGQCVGRLCLVEHAGTRSLCTVRRGTDDSTFTLVPFCGCGDTQFDVPLTNAMPVLWAKF